MKTSLCILAALSLVSGCAITPSNAYRLSDYDACRYAVGHVLPDSRAAALEETQRRGIDCRQYDAAIAANDAAMVASMASMPRPKEPINCLSRKSDVTGNIYTMCQ